MPVLSVRNLSIQTSSKRTSPVQIVKNVSFDVEKHEVVALIGESGSGKTTISLAALAYTRPGMEFSGGEIYLAGADLLRMPQARHRQIRGSRVSYLAQSAAATFNPAIPLGRQVIESAVIHGLLTPKQAESRARELFAALELPEPDRLGYRYPHQVSGGQLQRLMAAMALCVGPDLLVLDEPTTALDVTTQIEVLRVLKKVIKQQGTAAVYVTHDLSVVAQIADRVVVLYGGEIQEHGPVEQVIHDPYHDYTRRLMAAVKPIPKSSSQTAPRGRCDVRSDTPALQVDGLTAGYGSSAGGVPLATVLRDVSFSVQAGEVVGVIGESGCGKSTLARVIAGLLPASQGAVSLGGERLPPRLKKRTREQLRRVQFVFQSADTALNPDQRVAEILGRPLKFYCGLRGAAKRSRVAELLRTVELPAELAERCPAELSGGQKQRVNLARALASDPDVLLCDEVTSALDTIVGANVINLLKRLCAETGVAIVFISHDLSTISFFADHIVVLYAGTIVEQGPAHRVLAPPYHPYTRLLMESVPELRVGWLEQIVDARGASSGGVARGIQHGGRGCPFTNRCPLSIPEVCDSVAPIVHSPDEGHQIACHRPLADLDSA